jgi:hypothetical protein
MSRLRKAWVAHPKWSKSGDGDVFFAESSSKARYLARLEWSDTLDIKITQIRVLRAKHRDVILPDQHCLVAELTQKQRHMVAHAFGCDRHGNGHRDHYCTRPGNLDMLRLAWEFGLFRGPYGEGAYGETPGWCGAFFYLTDLGKLVAASMLPTYEGVQ